MRGRHFLYLCDTRCSMDLRRKLAACVNIIWSDLEKCGKEELNGRVSSIRQQVSHAAHGIRLAFCLRHEAQLKMAL
jgi:hypothetical protein